MKRVFDFTTALILCVLLLPLGLAVAVGVLLDAPGGVLFATRRAGLRGKPFNHLRFRTMAGDPPQKTRFGRWIGNLSLDDLPTLWNVLRGDLSLIGPRPERVEAVDLADPVWQKVLSVRPGLSGLGLLRLRERYNQSTSQERLAPELYYAEYGSFWFDLQLLGQTLYWWLRMGHLKGRF